MQFAHIMYTL